MTKKKNKAYEDFMLKSDAEKAAAAGSAGYTTIIAYEAALKGEQMSEYVENIRKERGDDVNHNTIAKVLEQDRATAKRNDASNRKAAREGAGNVGNTPDKTASIAANPNAPAGDAAADTEDGDGTSGSSDVSTAEGEGSLSGDAAGDQEGTQSTAENKPGLLNRIFGSENKSE